ncbi:putative LRR receptor-like serine/threonine-protein kinase [Morus notabilis]|uniref:Putative LRR receptor-like serine/threonine-protein kinase n=1 Tax=Morus notabilis TaxID=981085 RepID=W9RL90_9ROSA|nr:putative LRR receptor-like serine/threonine-protein kinase [Morus notabilis]
MRLPLILGVIGSDSRFHRLQLSLSIVAVADSRRCRRIYSCTPLSLQKFLNPPNICCVLGTPDMTAFPDGVNTSRLCGITSYEKILPANLSDIIPNASPEAIDLIRCFCFALSAPMDPTALGKQKTKSGALLNIKRDLQFWDVPDLLSSWGNEEGETDCCKWLGVGCANDSGHVISLDLSSISTLGINDYMLNWIVGGKINPSLFELRYLNYLDLSFIQFMGSRIPSSIGTLGHLRYLNLSYTFMGGEIPPQLANLSNLQVLDLGYNHYTINSLKWLSHLSSLIDLRLNGINLSKAYDWVQIVNQLPGLTTLELGYCNLRDVVIPPSFSSVNSSASSLSILNLSNNNLSVSVFSWLFNFSNSLVHLDLSVNQLEGSVPESFGKITALKLLDLSRNDKLSGSIPEAFSKMTALTYLDLSRDKFKGSIPEIFFNISSLEYLDLGDNMLEGELPKSIWNLSMLRTLRIASNNLSGNLPQTSFQKLKQLERLDISRNSLGGVISEASFSELSELHYLDLSFNSLALNIHSEWIPPFRLRNIFLGSCKLGPQFPKWLRTQKNYSFLDISNSGISDSIPNWFWNLSNGFQSMNLSNNQLNGEIGNISLDLHEELFNDNLDIDLSTNQLEGVVPSFLFKVAAVDLSRNRFSKLNVPCNINGHTALKFLDISYNELSGELPDCWSRLKELRLLILAKNKLAGKIPPSIGSLTEIEALRLTGNNFIGELPATLKNCTQFSVIDFGGNKLSGPIPTWIGENLHGLIILSMRSNYFSGSIPSHLCHLTNLQLLDLSLNDISGSIPKCVSNFTAMRKGWEDDRTTITHLYATQKVVVTGHTLAKSMKTMYNCNGKETLWSSRVFLGL